MWVDTSCFVEYFMEGKPGMANGLTASLGALKDLRITNRFYVYDTTYGTAIFLKYKITYILVTRWNIPLEILLNQNIIEPEFIQVQNAIIMM